MRAWTSPDVPALADLGVAGRSGSTTPRRARWSPATPRGPPGCTSAASRRTTPPTSATPRPTSPSTCSTGPGATPGTRSTTSRTSPTSTTRCSSGPTATGVDWQELAERETELFRSDMTALRVLAPDAYVGAVESIPLVVDLVAAAARARRRLRRRRRPLLLGALRPAFGSRRGPRRRGDARVFAERGGDPDRPGKKHPLDCLLWQARAARRAGLGLPAGPRPAGLAHRVLGDRPAPPRRRPSTSRAAAATWPSRTTR